MENKNILTDTKIDLRPATDVDDAAMQFLEVAFPLTPQYKLRQWRQDFLVTGRTGMEDDQEEGATSNFGGESLKAKWLNAAQEAEKVNRYIDQVASQERTENAVRRGVANALLDYMFSRHWFSYGDEDEGKEILEFEFPKLNVRGTAKFAKNGKEFVTWDFDSAVTAIQELREGISFKYALELAESAERNGYKRFAKLIREEEGGKVLSCLSTRDARVAFNRLTDPLLGYYRNYFSENEGDFTELRREFCGEGSGRGKVTGIYGKYLTDTTDLKRETMIQAFNSATDQFVASLSGYEKARKELQRYFVEDCKDINDRYKHMS